MLCKHDAFPKFPFKYFIQFQSNGKLFFLNLQMTRINLNILFLEEYLYERNATIRFLLSFASMLLASFFTLFSFSWVWEQSNLAQCHCDSAGNGLSPFVVTV